MNKNCLFHPNSSTIKNLLVFPKDRESITQIGRVMYRYNCDRTKCDKEYTRESTRTFGERLKEHLIPLSKFMTLTTSQVITPAWTISALWEERNTISPEPERKQYA